jgi:hypothetical protein
VGIPNTESILHFTIKHKPLLQLGILANLATRPTQVTIPIILQKVPPWNLIDKVVSQTLPWDK